MNDFANDPARRARVVRSLRILSWTLPWLLIAVLIAIVLMFKHHEHAIRAQIADAIATADGTRMAVAIYHARTGNWPLDNAAAGLLSPSAVEGKYVDDVHIETGMIVITLGGQADPRVHGSHIDLTPYLDGAVVRWRCKSRDVRPNFLPDDCRG